MKPLTQKDGVQIEITNYCIHACSNCTRFCGSHQHHYYMDYDYFQKAVDSLEGYPRIIGVMGGEPLLHPEFERFCNYLASKFPREQLGLWSTLPHGYEQHRAVICRTFGNILLNDHTLPEVMHAPLLVGIEELVPDKATMWQLIDNCWVQNAWSAAINPKGAFFCEVAAARAILFDSSDGWPIEKGWWKRIPAFYKEQMEEHCPGCGGALMLPARTSMDERDDISPKNLERLKGISRKVDRGEVVLFDTSKPVPIHPSRYPPQEYKNGPYRQEVAARYGMFLVMSERGFWDPYLKQTWSPGDAPLSHLVTIDPVKVQHGYVV